MVINSFTPSPVLTTERLILRQLSTDDGENIFALRSNNEINKYLERQPSKTVDDAIYFINKINDCIKNNESFYWAICLKNSNNLVGTICLFSFLNESDKCEIGYELLTNFHGQGIMTESLESVLDFAFNTMQIKQIEAFTHIENNKSTKLLVKAGFEKSLEADEENCQYHAFTLSR